MRLTCEAAILDRTQPQQKSRLVKSIVNIGEQNAEMFLLHENALNKIGRRYKMKLNVSKVFTKFLHEGKATISFIEPPHDLQIQCDKIRLMAFMRTLRVGLMGEPNSRKSESKNCQSNEKIKVRPLKQTPFTLKNHATAKMVIRNRSDLDKGIPRTVEVLTISGLGLHRFHSSILRLQNLSVLNLSNNELTEIPASVGYLPLTDINLAQNQLSNTNFAWLKHLTIQTTLRYINMSDNKLRYVPAILFKIQKLIVIKLSNNLIERIPFAIRKLKNLREFYIDKNELESLPDALSWISLEMLTLLTINSKL